MRSYSIFTILLLCVAILIVDILAFYWLQSITELIAFPLLTKVIHIVFWIFTVALITAILVLKIKLDRISLLRKYRFVSSLYGLTVSSFIPKLLFVIIISILYTTNAVFSKTESLIIVPLVGLLSGFLPFFIILYGIKTSLYRFKIYRTKITSKVFPKSFKPLKIVQISDIHLGSFNYQYAILEKAVTQINNLEPDLILFTGDLVNNYAFELRGWDTVFKKLKAKKGKYAVLGNHDYGDYSEWNNEAEKQDNFETIKTFFNTIGFKLLCNEAAIISENEEKIAIIGVENWGKPPFKQYGNLETALHDVISIPFKILLSHDPSHWTEEVINKTNITLTLSGHTHGMQAGIRLKNKHWSPIKYKYKHWAGLYKNKAQYLYVNRGLGWIGFPGRPGMRPEITLIELDSVLTS